MTLEEQQRPVRVSGIERMGLTAHDDVISGVVVGVEIAVDAFRG